MLKNAEENKNAYIIIFLWDLYKNVQTAEEKRTILKTFIHKILIYRDRWEVVFYI
mgnify:CR=1 FL=1